MSDDKFDALMEKYTALEKFVARRFDEISMEINATSQQMDFAEETFTKRFAEMFETIQALSYQGDGKSPANVGVELSAVIAVTENAANTILDAAELIKSLTKQIEEKADDDRYRATVTAIQKELLNIYMACEFQDITSQRITQAVNELNDVELEMSKALEELGIEKHIIKYRIHAMHLLRGSRDILRLFMQSDFPHTAKYCKSVKHKDTTLTGP